MKAVPLAHSDAIVESEIGVFRAEVEAWAVANDLWHDAGFLDYRSHVDGELSELPVVSILWYEGPLRDVVDWMGDEGLSREFHAIIEHHGYHFESNDYVSGWFYPDEKSEERTAAYRSYFHWQWVCSLIVEDCSDVYEELYQHFASRPDDLGRLHWRQLETLLFRIFQNQGFHAVLGKGTNDGGADVRLLTAPLGDVHTLVQAKRYHPRRKIKLEAVAALRGVVANERADHGIFVTTSDYLPSARQFAARSDGVIHLASSSDVSVWCRDASEMVVSDKSKLVSKSVVETILARVRERPDHRLVHASTGYSMVTNAFALVIKETKYAALLLSLPNTVISHDGYGQRGSEVPDLGPNALQRLSAAFVHRAKRTVRDDGRVDYWDGDHLFTPWDGNPVFFDLCD